MNIAALECAWKKDGAKGTFSLRGKSARLVGFSEHSVVRLGSMDDSRRIQQISTGQMVSRAPNQEENKEPGDTQKVKIENSIGGHRASGKTQTVYIIPGGIPPIPPPMPPAPGGGPISDGLIFFDAITSSILRIIDATSVAD